MRHTRPRPIRTAPDPRRAAAPLCVLALLLAACGDDGLDDSIPSGGGAGDEEATLLLRSLVGVYDLTGPWRGDAGDVAYLVVREPDGRESEVLVYDVDEGFGNCFERPLRGTARVDEFAQNDPTIDDVFLEGFLDFDAATLSRRADGALVIERIDALDLDGDGDRRERLPYVAPRFDQLAEMDFGPDC